MTDRIDVTDMRILAEVRELCARVDPPPAGLADRCKFALTVQALQAEVAELISAPEPALRGNGTYARTETVTFGTSTVTLMVRIAPSGPDAVRLDGWVTRPPAHVEVRGGGGVRREAVTDRTGRFVLEDFPRGPAHFVVRTSDPAGRPVITPTVDL